jgi:hypothetical protein
LAGTLEKSVNVPALCPTVSPWRRSVKAMSRYRANLVEGPLASLIVFIIPAAHLILSEVESVAADICHWF